MRSDSSPSLQPIQDPDTSRVHLAVRNNFSGRPPSFTRRAFLSGGIAAAASVGLYSGIHSRHQFEITHRTFAIRNLPDAFVGFRMVQMTDIHLHEFTEEWFLEKMVAETNALAPDVVLLTGDFISRGPGPHSVGRRAAGVCAEILSGLTAPQRFAILGNHDVSIGAQYVIDPLEAHGTPVLVDSYFALERGRDHIWLAGSEDAGTRKPDLSMAVPQYADAPVILMAHEPDFADQVIQHPRFPLIDLMLSGHTHGGQVNLPFFGPLILPPMGQRYIEGHFQFGHMQMYVSRGIGTTGLPFRLNCPAELTHITLVRA